MYFFFSWPYFGISVRDFAYLKNKNRTCTRLAAKKSMRQLSVAQNERHRPSAFGPNHPRTTTSLQLLRSQANYATGRFSVALFLPFWYSCGDGKTPCPIHRRFGHVAATREGPFYSNNTDTRPALAALIDFHAPTALSETLQPPLWIFFSRAGGTRSQT